MLQKIVVGPCGARFLKDCKTANRAVFLWTVNEDKWMRWSIRKGVDGVITDNPKRYLEVCKEYDESAPPDRLTVMDMWTMVWINALVVIFGSIFRLRYRFKIEAGNVKGK
jgi:phosphatidylglycerol phospholipase C